MTTRGWTLLVWAILGLMAVVLLALGTISRGHFPKLGSMVNQVTAHPAGRGALVLGWMWLGWHAFAR
jgi:hypothetical protein